MYYVNSIWMYMGMYVIYVDDVLGYVWIYLDILCLDYSDIFVFWISAFMESRNNFVFNTKGF